MIILGLIALLFPIVSTQTIGILTGLIVLLVGIGLLIGGFISLSESKIFGIVSILFAFLCFIFAYNLMFKPAVVSGLLSFIIYILGFILIVMGIIAILQASQFNQYKGVGIITLIFGIVTIVVGMFVHNPAVLGTLIGLWLIISGLTSLFGKKEKVYNNNDYIDV